MVFLRQIRQLTTLSISFLAFSQIAFGVTQYQRPAQNFVTDQSQLKPSISLPVSEDRKLLVMSQKKLEIRLKKGKKDDRVEPLNLSISKDHKKLSTLATKLAKPGMSSKVEELFIQKIRALGPNDKKAVQVTLEKEDFTIINPLAYTQELARPHHTLILNGAQLKKKKRVLKDFLKQLKGYLPKSEIKSLYSKLRKGASLNFEKELLPPFARKMVKKYTIFRGPNCFHAALAFQGQKLTKSPLINVKEEKGYHRAMINYDELWRAINTYFYEVDTKASPLKYGDMLVFFNVPKDGSSWINFRWIRHTATYLFGGYTFSKGSKSPNTPYSIKTLEDEWKTWENYTSNLGIKVYRRNARKLPAKPPQELVDWIY